MYRGQHYRPRPEVLSSENEDILVICTPWGPKSLCKSVSDQIKNHYLSSQQDIEFTSPFERLSGLNKIENDLRTSIFLANQSLYKSENKEDYVGGCEVFAAVFDSNIIYWAQVGSPALYLLRGKKVIPLNHSLDYSFDYSNETHLPSLPKKLLGIYDRIDLQINSFRLQQNDHLLWASHNFFPDMLKNLESLSLDSIMTRITQEYSQHSFWMGLKKIS